MENKVVGADISKKKFDVALLLDSKVKSKAFPNTMEGFVLFIQWLVRHGVTSAHICMEATGTYGDRLAEFLHKAGHIVSVVNPARIKGFAQGELSRTKTDKADAALIARFCLAMRPSAWEPPTPAIKALQAFARRLESLNDMLTQESNRLATAEVVVRPSIEAVIVLLKEEIKKTRRLIRESVDKDPDLRGKRDLLESIPGIGEVTSAIILAEFGGAERFGEARRMASFCGLAPKHRQSGTSVRGKSRMSKTGSSRIRRALYMPALVAMKHNPVVAVFCERLRGYGKPKMVIVGAVMRKLTHIIFGVLKSGKPFDPTHAVNCC